MPRHVYLLTLLGLLLLGRPAGYGAIFYPGVSPTNTFWTNGVIPYQFDTNYPTTPAQQSVFLDLCREWELAANIQLVPRASQTNYLRLRYDPAAGGGFFSLGDGTLANPSTLTVATLGRGYTHEMGHALGFTHEHQRPDRNSYINVNYSNMVAGAEFNFEPFTNALVLGAYDFESVMHYYRNNFSIPPYDLDVITPLPAYATKYYYRIGNLALSNGDRAAAAYLYGPPATPLTNVVTHTRDGGGGSLRAAIYYANDHPGTTIRFQLATNDAGFTNGIWTIQPTGDLPPLVADGTVIDGTTQSNYVNHPVIVLDSAALLPEAGTMSGLHIYAANCVVKALAFGRFTQWGLAIETPSATNNTIRGCHFGLDARGTNAMPNSYEGIGLFHGARYNVIGGTNASARNLISGNANSGVLIADTNTFGNVVQGNYIGLNGAGTGTITNRYYGVVIRSGASSNTIGGSVAGVRNVIAGNDYGIIIADTNSTANVVAGNYIGTDATGTLPLTNRYGGILVYAGAQNTVIGGTNAAARNVISGNGGSGLTVAGANTTNTVVRGNFIGTDPTGLLAVPNDTGVDINTDAKNTTVGGTNVAERNLISGNRYTGLSVQGTNTSDTTIQGNYVGVAATGTSVLSNGGAGIFLGNGARHLIVGGAAPGAGNFISGNGGDGVSLYGAGTISNSVLGNLIGTDQSGTNALPNATGISLNSGPRFNRIGDATPGGRNVISGNRYNGILFFGAGTASNSVLGNFIGTTIDGTAALTNYSDNVSFVNGPAGNIVGGPTTAARNLISGSIYSGVYFYGVGTDGNIIQGNYIGTDVTGNLPLGNGSEGVALFGGARGNLIGGATPGAGNVIGANRYRGVILGDPGTSENLVQGNNLGVGADGITPLGNGDQGILVYGGASSNGVGLKTDGSGVGNRIAHSFSAGAQVDNTNSVGNTIRGNAIYNNDGLGLDLAAPAFWGVTPNDLGDGDAGPNNLQNHPIITNGFTYAATSTVFGTLNSAANRTYLIDVYRNASADLSGYGEGQNYLGSTSITTSGSGNASFSFTAEVNFSGDYITATATDAISGDTSEFSPAVLATNAPAPPQFIFPLGFTSTGFVATVGLTPGQNYRFQATTNLGLTPIPWMDLTNFVASTTNYLFLDRTATNHAIRFYRAVSP